MTYKIRPGIVMLKVCDARFLVAERRLWDEFSSVHPVSKKQAVLWSLMEQGQDSDQVLVSLAKIFQKPVEDIYQRFEPIIKDLAVKGYLITVGEEEK